MSFRGKHEGNPHHDRHALKATKRALRKEIKKAVEAIGREGLDEESEMISRYLESLDEWHHARTIFTFLSMEHEIDTFRVVGRALSDGKRIGVPRMHDEDLHFHTIESLDGPWEEHPYGVQEPHPTFPIANPADPAFLPILVVTPGIAFDKKGRRLGFGRGFYDKFFAEAASLLTPGGLGANGEGRISIGEATGGQIVSVAVCDHRQIVEQVPAGVFDVPVDIVVTGSGIAYYRGCKES